MSIGLFRTVELLRRLCRSSDFKQRWTFSQCMQKVLSSFTIIRWTKIIFKSANSRKQANSTDWSTTTRALRFTLEGLHQRHPNYISPGTKKGIKYRSQQALEGLRAFGWKVSGLRSGSSCQDIRTGTLSNQVAWRILQTKAGSFLVVKVRIMSKGSPHFKKVQFFLTLFKRPLTPPFYLNICPILQGVFFERVFEHLI